MTLAAGATLQGRYRLVAIEQEGPHFQRWEARQLATGRVVRVHVLEALGGKGRGAGKHRFQRELARLAEVRHGGVAALLDGGPLGDGRHFVAQDAPGETLAAHVARVGGITARKVERLMTQALDALGAAHRLGLVHRALSPEALLVCLGGLRRSLVVVDLGVVALLEASLDAAPGSLDPVAEGLQPPGFASPAAGAAADLHAWAAMLRRLLGRHAESERWAPVLARLGRKRLASVAGVDAVVRGLPEPGALEGPKSDRAPSFQRLDDVEVLEDRLALFTRQRQWAEAIEVLVRLCELERDPLKAAKHALAAGMLIEGELGDAARALGYYRLALDRCPDADRALTQAEKLLRAAGDVAGLAALYRELLGRLPVHARATRERTSRRFHLLVKLGAAERERGQRALAREAYEEAASMRPDDADVRAALRQLTAG